MQSETIYLCESGGKSRLKQGRLGRLQKKKTSSDGCCLDQLSIITLHGSGEVAFDVDCVTSYCGDKMLRTGRKICCFPKYYLPVNSVWILCGRIISSSIRWLITKHMGGHTTKNMHAKMQVHCTMERLTSNSYTAYCLWVTHIMEKCCSIANEQHNIWKKNVKKPDDPDHSQFVR